MDSKYLKMDEKAALFYRNLWLLGATLNVVDSPFMGSKNYQEHANTGISCQVVTLLLSLTAQSLLEVTDWSFQFWPEEQHHPTKQQLFLMLRSMLFSQQSKENTTITSKQTCRYTGTKHTIGNKTTRLSWRVSHTRISWIQWQQDVWKAYNMVANAWWIL